MSRKNLRYSWNSFLSDIVNMEPYFFTGVVLPERARVGLGWDREVEARIGGASAKISVRIALNQIAVWVDTDTDWNVWDLRNEIKTLIQSTLSVCGYFSGNAYDFEITRVVCRERNIDVVFGINIQCITTRYQGVFNQSLFIAILNQFSGEEGLLLQRCFADLTSAMQRPLDTAFYCYRAIESLNHHCASIHGLHEANEGVSEKALRDAQWRKFRQVAQIDRDKVMFVKDASDVVRHGRQAHVTDDDRIAIFTATWGIVDSYLNKLPGITFVANDSFGTDDPPTQEVGVGG